MQCGLQSCVWGTVENTVDIDELVVLRDIDFTSSYSFSSEHSGHHCKNAWFD